MVAPIADAELVARSRRRDADAFGMLVERHQRLVFGVALARCRDPSLAEDVAQEAFVSAWRDLDRLRDSERVGSWVAGIARNLASNAARRRERHRVDTPEAATAPSPEDEALEREDRELLQRALADVPDAHREALVLYYLEGESCARIAELLGITEDLVKQRLSRGRRALREGVAARVESALVRARSGTALRAGVVAAVTLTAAREAGAATTVSSAAGKVIAIVSTKKVIAAAAVVMFAVGGGALWYARAGAAPSDEPRKPATLDPAKPSATDSLLRGATPSLHVRKLADPAMRPALLDRIHQQAARRTAGTASSPATSGAAPSLSHEPRVFDKEYIDAAIHEIVPILEDCYQEGLERDPTMIGNISIEFTIEGERDTGGVIGESKIDPTESTLTDQAVRECIQETMYGLQMDPPPEGHKVRTRTLLVFSNVKTP